MGGRSGPQLFLISSRACFSTVSLVEFSHFTNSSISPKSRLRSVFTAASVGNRSGWLEGSSTSCANNTARHVANGLRDHHRCRVEGWPWRMDFSRTEALLMASRGRATSMSFRFGVAASFMVGKGLLVRGNAALAPQQPRSPSPRQRRTPSKP